jgi:hypothetical protein
VVMEVPGVEKKRYRRPSRKRCAAGRGTHRFRKIRRARTAVHRVQRWPFCANVHAVEQDRSAADQRATERWRHYADAEESSRSRAKANRDRLRSGGARSAPLPLLRYRCPPSALCVQGERPGIRRHLWVDLRARESLWMRSILSRGHANPPREWRAALLLPGSERSCWRCSPRNLDEFAQHRRGLAGCRRGRRVPSNVEIG